MAPRSVLSGGVRRRHGPPLLPTAGVLLVVTAVSAVLAFHWTTGEPRSSVRINDAARQVHGAKSLRTLEGARRSRTVAGSAEAGVAGGGGVSGYALDLSQPDAVRLRFVRRPRAGLLFDLRDGRVLWRLNPTRRLAIASLTKMMTALIVVERDGAHARVRISKRAVRTQGSAVGVLPKGKRVQLEALLNGLLLVSGNDAAVALAQYTAGTVQGFVALMNKRAAQLGLSCTRFSSPHGLRDRGNHSCAADLAELARADMAQRRLRKIVRRRLAIVRFPIKGGRLFLYNNNPLMRSGYRGVTGLKTGYTDRAGASIVATARRGRTALGVVLLHSYNPTDQASKLLDRGFKTCRTRFVRCSSARVR